MNSSLNMRNIFIEYLVFAISICLFPNRAQRIDPSRRSLDVCGPFFPESQYADIVHAATCLEAGATIVTNDAHFKKIQEAGLIEVWNISKAIREILDKGD
jgi:hypothetical protein